MSSSPTSTPGAGGKPLQGGGDEHRDFLPPHEVAKSAVSREEGAPRISSTADTLRTTAAVATRGGGSGRGQDDDMERGMGIDFYSVDNPLLLASWASFFRDQYIAAMRRKDDGTIGHRLAPAQQQQHRGERNHNTISQSPCGLPEKSNYSLIPAGMSKKARLTKSNSCSTVPSGSDPRLNDPPHDRATENEEQEVECHYHPPVQSLVEDIIKSQATKRSSDIMENVFRRFPFWCGRAFTEGFYSAAMVGLRWRAPGQRYSSEFLVVDTPQWRDFLCHDHGFQRFAERSREIYLERYAKDIANIAGLYYRSDPEQGKLLLEALLYIAKNASPKAGEEAISQHQFKEYEEACNTKLTFYVFLYVRYTPFSHFDVSKHLHEALSFEGEAFVLEVVLTLLEEITANSHEHHLKKTEARRPSPSCLHPRQPRNPMWHEGRALVFQRSIEAFRNTKKEQGGSFSQNLPGIKSFDINK